MHVEIFYVSCILVKTVKTQKQIKYQKKSSLNSKAEEKKYVSDVLTVNGYTNTFLYTCQKPVTTSNTPDEKEAATGFAVISYIQGVMEPNKRTLNSHKV